MGWERLSCEGNSQIKTGRVITGERGASEGGDVREIEKLAMAREGMIKDRSTKKVEEEEEE